MIAYVYVRTDRQTKDKKKRMFTTSKCSHLFFCIVYIHISNGYNTWTALSNSHPRSLLASIYPFRIKIKPKHLASYFHFYFYLNMLQTILHTHFTTSNRYIWSIFFRKMFFYMLLCKWLPPVIFDRRWTVFTTTFIKLWI